MKKNKPVVADSGLASRSSKVVQKKKQDAILNIYLQNENSDISHYH